MRDPIMAVIDLLESVPELFGLQVFADLDPNDPGAPDFPYVTVEEVGGIPIPVGGGPDIHRLEIRTFVYARGREQARTLGLAAAAVLDWAEPDLGHGSDSIKLIPTAEPHTGKDPDPGPANEKVWRCMLNHTFMYREVP